MSFASIDELLDEFRAGRMVVVVDDEDRENEGDLIMAAELVRPTDINFMVTHARGLVCLSLTRERCRQLGLGPMVSHNRSQYHTNFTVSIEAAEGVTTGISAYDRAHTIRTAVRPDAKPDDLHQPGHIFPLMAQPGGVLTRAGHTEAAADLALLAGLEPAGVLVEILNPDGSMARRPQLEVFAREHGLTMGSIADLIRHRLSTEKTVQRVDEREVETAFGRYRLHTYRDVLSHDLHFALTRGEGFGEGVTTVRVQAKSVLSDVLHLRRDDLGMSLADALAAINQSDAAVLVLLADHHDADTVLALLTQRPSPEPTARGELAQWRRNGAGAQILADLGVRRMRVIGTPRKHVALAGFGLEVVEYLSPRCAPAAG